MEGDSRLLQRGVTSLDVADLLDVLKDLSSDWDLFMIQLIPGVQGEVDAIRTNRAGQGNYCQKCLSDGLNHFVKTSTKPTYDDIHKVLRRESLKNAPVADKLLEHLREKYNSDADQSDNGELQRDGGSQEQQPPPNQQCNMFRKWLWPAVLVVVALAVPLCFARFSVPYGDIIPNSRESVADLISRRDCSAELDERVAASRPSAADIIFMVWKNDSDDSQYVFRLKDSILAGCKELGATFGLSYQVLKAICPKGHDASECCDEVIRRWAAGSIEKRDAYPYSWAGLIRALRNAHLEQAASDLECALAHRD